MTIASIATLARQRSAPASMGYGKAPGAAPAAADPSPDISALVNAVPIDVIVLYTTVIGVLAGVLKDASANSYLPLRWAIYGGCIAGICILVPLTFYLQGQPGATRTGAPGLPVGPPVGQALPGAQGPQPIRPRTPRVIPVSETVIAALSFAFWGLIIPGSPLYVALKPPTLPVTVTTLSAVGVFVMTSIVAPVLRRPAQSGRGTSWLRR
jgi:hypothetical protein